MDNINPSISSYLRNKFPNLQTDFLVQPISGGDTCSSYKISSKDLSFFLKVNTLDMAAMFISEAKALKILKDKSVFRIPKVLAQDSVDDFSFLVLEFLEMKRTYTNGQELGKLLADLHKNSSDCFGLDHDNYIGNLVQINTPSESWSEFYVCHRLEVQFKEAFNKGYFSTSDHLRFGRFCHKLEQYIPMEKPALIHGDLWAGNYAEELSGNSIIFDPALHYGHREMDLAMMKLFGGFPPEVFKYYDLHFPLQEEWVERIPIHQLYPILVHSNLFGISYAKEAKSIWNKFL